MFRKNKIKITCVSCKKELWVSKRKERIARAEFLVEHDACDLPNARLVCDDCERVLYDYYSPQRKKKIAYALMDLFKAKKH